MRELRNLPEKVEECLKELPPDPHPMDILKVAMAHALYMIQIDKEPVVRV